MRASAKILFVCTIAAVAVYAARAPIRRAAKIQRGDSAARVHELLGAPEEVFTSTAELQASRLGPMSYAFADREGGKEIPVSQLPPVAVRAEWFPYASAGCLVYYDDAGVTDVFWGGT